MLECMHLVYLVCDLVPQWRSAVIHNANIIVATYIDFHSNRVRL